MPPRCPAPALLAKVSLCPTAAGGGRAHRGVLTSPLGALTAPPRAAGRTGVEGAGAFARTGTYASALYPLQGICERSCSGCETLLLWTFPWVAGVIIPAWHGRRKELRSACERPGLMHRKNTSFLGRAPSRSALTTRDTSCDWPCQAWAGLTFLFLNKKVHGSVFLGV